MKRETQRILDATDSPLERAIQATDRVVGKRLPPGFIFFMVLPLALCGLIAWLRT